MLSVAVMWYTTDVTLLQTEPQLFFDNYNTWEEIKVATFIFC